MQNTESNSAYQWLDSENNFENTMGKIVVFGEKYAGGNLTNTEHILRKVANILSIVFHPMMMPIYAMLFLLYGHTMWSMLPAYYKTITLIQIGVATCLLPLASISILVAMGYVGDPEMPNKSERVLPLGISSIIIGVACFYMHLKAELPFPLIRMSDGMFVMMIVSMCISSVWKISLHGMGVGALLVFVCVVGITSCIDFSMPACVTFAIAGTVAWARMYLDAHTPTQLLVGFLLGTGCMLFAMLHP